MSPPAFELDHVFVMSSIGAAEGAELLRAGLPEGSPNTHPGQGTACRRFVLGNAYIELLWVHDENEARSEPVRETGLWERWAGRTGEACPFGVVLRPAGEEEAPPFDAWEYRPSYLPSPLAIHVARDAPLTEPAFFYLPFLRRGTRLGATGTPADVRRPAITHVTVSGPRPAQSAPALAVAAAGWLTFDVGAAHAMTLVLDGDQRDDPVDLRPHLPLVMQRKR